MERIDDAAAVNVTAHDASRRMRATSFAAVGLLLASLAGCVADDDPDESAEAPFEEPTNATTAVPTPAPGDGFVVVDSAESIAPGEPTPTTAPTPPPAPASEPTPEPAPREPASPAEASEPNEETWPREGSFVRVRGSASESAPNTFVNASQWMATWRYVDGDWVGECEGTWETDWHEDSGNEDTSGSFSRKLSADDPPHWPLFDTRDPPDEGESVQAWVMWGCDIESASMVYSGLDDGRHRADDTPEAEGNYSDFTTFWDQRTGLVLEWDWARRTSGTRGELVDTDAPGL